MDDYMELKWVWNNFGYWKILKYLSNDQFFLDVFGLDYVKFFFIDIEFLYDDMKFFWAEIVESVEENHKTFLCCVLLLSQLLNNINTELLIVIKVRRQPHHSFKKLIFIPILLNYLNKVL